VVKANCLAQLGMTTFRSGKSQSFIRTGRGFT
jgi:hypothetical protein